MSSVVVFGLLGSLVTALLLVVLFRIEGKRGVRYADTLRRHADFFVLKAAHAFHATLRYVGGSALRQILHYLFHSVLSVILEFIKQCESGLRNMIRSNRTIARNAERESATLNKLEEIALHKVASALTEEEKKAHREKVLSGK